MITLLIWFILFCLVVCPLIGVLMLGLGSSDKPKYPIDQRAREATLDCDCSVYEHEIDCPNYVGGI